MAMVDRDSSPEEITGAERTFEVRLGSLGGIEVRPTRLFVWKGKDRDESQQLVPLADRPVGLEYPRRESRIRVGGVEMRSRGNPLMTLALAGVIAIKSWANADEERPAKPPD